MTEIDIAGLRALARAKQEREMHVPTAYRMTVIEMEITTVLALCDALAAAQAALLDNAKIMSRLGGAEHAREIERLRAFAGNVARYFDETTDPCEPGCDCLHDAARALSGASDVNHGMAVHGPSDVNHCPCSPSDDICSCAYDCECRERHPHIYDEHEGYLVGRDAQERKDACCGVNSQSTAGEAQE